MPLPPFRRLIPIGDGSGSPAVVTTIPSKPPVGPDVSSHQEEVDWTAVKSWGGSFAYIKATEGTTYKNPFFNSQWSGSTAAGFIRGSYHFGRPDGASGADQANFFVKNGGGWSADGITLPGALDIEYNYNAKTDGTNSCYGVTKAAMKTWLTDFMETYHALTGRWPVIYTTKDWWQTCTGDLTTFSANCPLWLAGETSPMGGWTTITITQHLELMNKIDWNTFGGTTAQLQKLALGDGTEKPMSTATNPASATAKSAATSATSKPLPAAKTSSVAEAGAEGGVQAPDPVTITAPGQTMPSAPQFPSVLFQTVTASPPDLGTATATLPLAVPPSPTASSNLIMGMSPGIAYVMIGGVILFIAAAVGIVACTGRKDAEVEEKVLGVRIHHGTSSEEDEDKDEERTPLKSTKGKGGDGVV